MKLQNISKLSLLFVLAVAANSVANILPSNSGNTITNDPFVRYQWALKNEGQSVRKDLDDIHSVIVESNPKIQIGWSPEIDLQLKRDVIVAVVDSGVDSEHEDLKGRIALNEKECKDGKIQNGPTGDPDGNGFEGDCQGWSFVAVDKKRARLSDDEIGHGTHIAGIIAAGVNNGIGVSGLSNRIKILPLKVYDAKEERGSTISRIPLSERVAQAVEYAVLRKVDVINLSLGWPAVINTDRVRLAIEKAIAAGVVIVAGAGNDRHEKQIFPCSYENVICVGSIDLNGSTSRFSNFGGHVDIYAPGASILSTYPSLLVSNIFGPKGYEILSGTSQATPYVAGAAAILKGIFSGASAAEVKARLIKGSSDNRLLNITNSINLKNTEMVIPSFKGIDRIVVNSANGHFQLPIKIKSFSKSANLNIKVRSLNQSVVLTSTQKAVSIKSDELTTVQFDGTVNDSNTNSVLEYQIIVDGISYNHQLSMVREIPNNLTFTLENSSDLGISSVKVYGEADTAPQYFSYKTENNGVSLTIYKLSANGKIEPIGTTVVPRISDLLGDLSVLRIDANYDGKLDYIIGGKILDPETKDLVSIQYSYLNSSVQPLFVSRSHFVLDFESVVPTLKGLKFGKYSSPEFGSVAVPVFFAEGLIPKLDLNPDPFAFEQNFSAWRLYYLEPTVENNSSVFKTRSFFNALSIKKFKKQLGITIKNDFIVQSLLAQSLLDFNNGKISVLASTGNGILRKYLLLDIIGSNLQEQKIIASTIENNGIDLQRQATEEILGFSTSTQKEFLGTNIVGIFSQHKARTVGLEKVNIGAAVNSVIQIDLDDKEERVMGLIKTFRIDSESISFFEADTTLHAVGSLNGKPIKLESPIYRSSFLPGQFFTQRFTPVFVSAGANSRVPGLLVDNTPVFAPVLSVWTINANNELFVPLKLNFEIPQSCRAMNPVKIQGKHHAAIICRDSNKNINLKFVPIE